MGSILGPLTLGNSHMVALTSSGIHKWASTIYIYIYIYTCIIFPGLWGLGKATNDHSCHSTGTSRSKFERGAGVRALCGP